MMHSNITDGDKINYIDVIQQMRRRERTYVVADYLPKQQMVPNDPAVDRYCRFLMINWMEQVVDFCGMRQDTVAVAVSLLDRYTMSNSVIKNDRNKFQLAAITCLYTAIKFHEHSVLSVSTMVAMCQNGFTQDQIESMERDILKANNWLVNVPTSYGFCEYLCAMLADVHSSDYEPLLELAKLQLNATISDFDLALMPPSAVAVAAVLNALDAIDALPVKDEAPMQFALLSVTQNQLPEWTIRDIRARLYASITDETESSSKDLSSSTKDFSEGSSMSITPGQSPRSVPSCA
eukprot:Nitzschia sp. Nitz4//scaffold113_size70149//49495//50370//NITZ4_005957-RA/size70149-processed-gene-0.61-mRNA-1//1//CDS//3329533362//8080//frame0